MLSNLLFILGSLISIGWGIAHIIPTKQVVTGFGDISKENRLIITMEWISEGITLCFVGTLVLVLTIMGFSSNQTGIAVIRLASLMLVSMAILSLFTGAKTSITPIKICPIVKTFVAVLWFITSIF